jgi:HlyD family secretion protein
LIAAEILDENSLYLEAFVEEVEMSRLRIGGTAAIAIDGLPTQQFTGKIIQFGRKAEFSPKYVLSEKERQSMLFKIKIAVNTEDRPVFKLGMPVTIKLPVE